MLPELEAFWWLAVGNGDVPPALPRGPEVPVSPAPEIGGVGGQHCLPRATRVHHVCCQVDKLVVFYLERKNKFFVTLRNMLMFFAIQRA